MPDPDLASSPTRETAVDEIRQRIIVLNNKIASRRERAEEERRAAVLADADADRLIVLREQYEALLP